MRLIKFVYLLIFASVLCACQASNTQENQGKTVQKPMNVLMISVDDLNHFVRHLNRNQQTISPNIDALAAKGMSFHRAYAPSAICNASRSAMMTGLRPTTSGIYENGRDWRSVVGSGKSLPAFYKQNGFKVLGGGKIFHNDKVIREEEWDFYFTKKTAKANNIEYKLEGQDLVDAQDSIASGPTLKHTYGKLPIAEIAGGDDKIWDYQVARWAADELKKEHEKPFFMAVGIFRPHLPWAVPKKYFDMYKLEDIVVPKTIANDLDDLPYEPSNKEEHDLVLQQGTWKEAVRAYLASITYADVQVGRVLDALNNGPNKDNTIIVLWGDHGWHLGEKNRWRKFALWEEATRTPYIWYAPGLTKAGSKTETPVDLQSLWPTLAELSNLNAPNHIDGDSVVPLLKNPNAKWQKPAIMTQSFNNHAIRSADFRYIKYNEGGEELYDHRVDPYEWDNLVPAGQHKAEIEKLKRWLPKENQVWDKAAKIYGGDPAFGKFRETKMVDKLDSKTD